jgi:formiminotetrahydrofolate cyclodeaminase
MSLAARPLEDLLDNLAAKTPTPGGGAAVGVAAALGAALGEMVVNYSVGKKRLREHEPELQSALGELARSRDLLLRLSDEDAAAYEKLHSMFQLAKDDPQRVAEMPAAVVAAIRVPQACVACCADLLRLLDALAQKTNKQLRSDLVVAALLTHAAARAADCNVRINLPLLEAEADKERVARETEQALENARRFAERIEHTCLS